MEPSSFDTFKRRYVEGTNRIGVLAVSVLLSQIAANQAPYPLEIVGQDIQRIGSND